MWTLSGFGDEISTDLTEQCQVLNSLRVGHIEVRSAWGVNVLDLDDDRLARVRAVLAEHGLRVSSIGSPVGKPSIHVGLDDQLRRLDRALHVAEVLAAPYIRIFSFQVDGDRARHRDTVVRRLAAFAARARDRGVVLLNENEAETYCDTPERCLDVLEAVGSEWLRLAWDFANFAVAGVRPYREAYPLLRPYIEYVQVKDARAGQIVRCGDGDAEIEETLVALRADGFDGFFSLEPHLAPWDAPDAGVYVGAHTAFTDLLTRLGIDHR